MRSIKVYQSGHLITLRFNIEDHVEILLRPKDEVELSLIKQYLKSKEPNMANALNLISWGKAQNIETEVVIHKKWWNPKNWLIRSMVHQYQTNELARDRLHQLFDLDK